MRVFISWSGERSRSLALALKDWLPLVLSYAEPWLSDADIEAGDRWGQSIAAELAVSNFGILCITSENVNSPWVLFEAGALTKSLDDSKVIPLLFDLEFSDVSGPLAQFQAKKIDLVGLREVIASIQKSAETPIPEDRANKLFDALWPELESQFKSVPKEPPAERSIRPPHEVLEELVASVRSLDGRFKEAEDLVEFPRRLMRRPKHMHPMMLMEVEEMLGLEPGDPIGILIVFGFIREEAPWLYELALEAYRALRDGDRRDSDLALERLDRAVKLLRRGPMEMEMFGLDVRGMEIFAHEVSRFLEHTRHASLRSRKYSGME